MDSLLSPWLGRACSTLSWGGRVGRLDAWSWHACGIDPSQMAVGHGQSVAVIVSFHWPGFGSTESCSIE